MRKASAIALVLICTTWPSALTRPTATVGTLVDKDKVLGVNYAFSPTLVLTTRASLVRELRLARRPADLRPSREGQGLDRQPVDQFLSPPHSPTPLSPPLPLGEKGRGGEGLSQQMKRDLG
jgi:hypothetical protein